MRGLALIDLGTIVIEIGGERHCSVNLRLTLIPHVPVLVSLMTARVVDTQHRIITFAMIFLLCLPLGPLLISLLFRITTVHKTKGKVLTQRLRFLGCCAPSHPPYTVLSIILNRSLARPLVRYSVRGNIIIILTHFHRLGESPGTSSSQEL
jgi:hypothetical protein